MLCRFCRGTGHHFYLRKDRPAWWFCQPCQGTGTYGQPVPAEIRIGSAQMRFLKPHPEQKGSRP
jgi:hypothetical protein